MRLHAAAMLALLCATPAAAQEQPNIYERKLDGPAGPQAQGNPNAIVGPAEGTYACSTSRGRASVSMETWANGAARVTAYFFDKETVVGQRVAFGAGDAATGAYVSTDRNFAGEWMAQVKDGKLAATICWGPKGADACKISTGEDAPVPAWCKQ